MGIANDPLQKEKNVTCQKYNSLFGECGNVNDDGMGMELNIFRCVHTQKMESNEGCFSFDQNELVLIGFNDNFNQFGADGMDDDDLGFIELEFEYFDYRKILLHKTPKFFEKAL